MDELVSIAEKATLPSINWNKDLKEMSKLERFWTDIRDLSLSAIALTTIYIGSIPNEIFQQTKRAVYTIKGVKTTRVPSENPQGGMIYSVYRPIN